MDGKDDYSADIGKKVYDLTWKGDLWGVGGALAWSRSRFFYLKSAGREGEGASALSSTYYTAWGNAVSHIKQLPNLEIKIPRTVRSIQLPFLKSQFGMQLLWLVRAIGCAIMSLSWSNFAKRKIGFKNMSHGQLDIRASILTKWHMYRLAEKYLHLALCDKNITSDSRALILCKLGEVRDKRRKNDGASLLAEAAMIPNLKNTTRVRVLKALGTHMLRQKKSRRLGLRFLGQALEIAEKENLGDQIVKIKALIKKDA